MLRIFISENLKNPPSSSCFIFGGWKTCNNWQKWNNWRWGQYDVVKKIWRERTKNGDLYRGEERKDGSVARRAVEWCVPRSVFFVFFETFLTGTCACIYSRKMCQRPFWAKPSTYNWSQRPNLSNFCRPFFRNFLCRGPLKPVATIEKSAP